MDLLIPGRKTLLRCLVLASFTLGLPGCAKNLMIAQSGAVVADAVVVTAVVATLVAACSMGCPYIPSGGGGSSFSSGGSPEATAQPSVDAAPAGGVVKGVRNL